MVSHLAHPRADFIPKAGIPYTIAKEKSMPKKEPKKIRGVFERPKGSGIWWICYFDPTKAP
jgi:hypothetical protein